MIKVSMRDIGYFRNGFINIISREYVEQKYGRNYL